MQKAMDGQDTSEGEKTRGGLAFLDIKMMALRAQSQAGGRGLNHNQVDLTLRWVKPAVTRN